MTIAHSRIQSLKEMLALEEKRASLQGQLDAINQRMSVLKDSVIAGGSSAASASSIFSSAARGRGRPPGSKNKREGAGPGTYREYIMAALEAAGDAGLRVKDLALSMKTKPVNIHSWFHSNLKRIPSIEKLTGGHYRLANGAQGSASTGKAAPAPKVAKSWKPRRGRKRGAVTATILENLKAAGPSGVKIADLADKMGAKYKNIYIWFATTGKKHGVKRIAPATYRLA